MVNIFLKVLELSLVGCYVILFVLAARVLLRKSPKWCSYLLWSVVFLRLILPVVPESNFSLVPAGVQLPKEVVTEVRQPVEDTQVTGNDNTYVSDTNGDGVKFEDISGDDISSTPVYNQADASQSMPEDDNVELEAKGDFLNPETPEVSNEANSGFGKGMLLQVAAYIWLAGAVLFGGYHFVSYHKFKSHLKGAVQTETGVYEIPGKHVSFVMGILRPAIFLSDSLDAETRKVVLCHERVHLKRRDYLIKPLALAISCVHWFNPLVWLAFYLMNRDCEMSCDEKVVSILGEDSKKTYSYALLDEATRGERLKYKRENMCAVLSFGEENIKSRIKHVLHFKKAPVWLIGISVVVLVVIAAGLCSNSKPEEAFTESEFDMSEYHNTPEAALQEWAFSFTTKNGYMLYEMSHDKEAFENWDMVTVLENGYAFGDSSPWPWLYDYEIDYTEGEKEATIRYWMRNFVPEVYPAEERVKIVKDGDLYYVDHQSMIFYSNIETLEEFMAAYVRKEDRDDTTENRLSNSAYPWYGWTGNTGYDKSHMRDIFNHVEKGTNPDYYDAYKDPVAAAKLMLNLGEGTGEVTTYLYEAESQITLGKGTYGVAGEGTIVNVEYTFAKDGSKLQIPMVLAEQSQGIWALSAGDLTKVESYTKGALPADANFLAREVKEELELKPGITYQISDYGIYELSAENFQCIYLDSMKNVEHVVADQDIYIYYPTDSLYESGALDWDPDSLCQINVITGESQYVPFAEAGYIIGEDVFFDVEAGYIFLENTFSPSHDGIYILEDAGKVWKGKTTAELSDEEKNEYGVANREYILSHPGEMVRLGNRYKRQTDAFVDMNGDGKTERIAIGYGEGVGQYYPYDDYVLKLDDWQEYRYANRLHNEIWAISPDGKHIYIALYEDGPSADPKTTFLRYDNGTLMDAGKINSDSSY